MRELIRNLVRRDELCDNELGCWDTDETEPHGPNCPMAVFDFELASTGAGRVIQHALLLRRAMHSAKLRYTAREISYESLLILGMLDEEESKFTEEKSKRPQKGQHNG